MIDLDLSDYRRFFERLGAAARGDFKREIAVFLDGVGFDFLKSVQNLMASEKINVEGRLSSSFSKGGEDNVFEVLEDGMALEVGTNLEYAEPVEKGHAKVKLDTKGAFFLPDGRLARFVPGRWTVRGDGKKEFEYSGKNERGDKDPDTRKTLTRPSAVRTPKDTRKERNRSSNGGMILTEGNVKGLKFFERAWKSYGKVFEAEVEKRLQDWLDRYFSDFS